MCIKQAAKATTRKDLLEMISAAEVEVQKQLRDRKMPF